jgi:hypothetical protein
VTGTRLYPGRSLGVRDNARDHTYPARQRGRFAQYCEPVQIARLGGPIGDTECRRVIRSEVERMMETTGEAPPRQSASSDLRTRRTGGETKPAFPLALVVRVTSHLAIWAVILIPTAMEMARGWRPLLDDATISARSYGVLSLHSPLLGQFSQASFSHGSTTASHLIFSPGPLQYWLLAIPVHLDPTQGALWGAALWSGAILSLAAEAAWSRVGWVGCAGVALVVIDLAWTVPRVFVHLVWNPYFGLVFFLATVVFALVVATGSLGWWPVLVATASVASQTHLVFFAASVALALAAPVLGVVRNGRPDRLRWLWVGIGVGAVCWLAPVMQELTARPGNLTLLVTDGASRKGLGVDAGFRVLGTQGSVLPIWLTRATDTGWRAAIGSLHSPTYGIFLLALMISIVVCGRVFGHRDLSSVAILATLCSLATVFMFTSYPVSESLFLYYLDVIWWVEGILLWLVVGGAAFVLLRSLSSRRSTASAGSTASAASKGPSPGSTQVGRRRWAVLAGSVVALLLVSTVFGVRAMVSPSSKLHVMTVEDSEVARITAAVERAVPRGPVAVVIKTTDFGLTFFGVPIGVAWQLTADGWLPTEPMAVQARSAFYVPAHTKSPIVVITVQGGHVGSKVTHR